jgi:hypothetical protein
MVGVMNFPRQTMFLIKVALEMDCCASIFGFKISTTSTTLGNNHIKVGQLMILIQKIKIGGK